MKNLLLFSLLWMSAFSMARAANDDMQVIRGFSMDRSEVSIAQFGRYVQATGVVTTAERAGRR